MALLKKVSHKNIVRLYEVIESEEKIYMVMDYMAHGPLLVSVNL